MKDPICDADVLQNKQMNPPSFLKTPTISPRNKAFFVPGRFFKNTARKLLF